MRMVKTFGVAVVVLVAITAVMSATASAVVVMLPEVEDKWTGTSGSGTLEVLPGGVTSEIVCKADTSEGTIEKSGKLGLFHIHFTGCKASIVPCTGLSDKEGEILTLGTYHLVYDKLAPVGAGILFLVEATHFTCAGKLFIIEGQVLCLIKPINTKTKHFEIVCEQEKGDPKETVYWNDKGEEVKMGLNLLLSKENEGAGKGAGELTTALILTTKEFELMA